MGTDTPPLLPCALPLPVPTPLVLHQRSCIALSVAPAVVFGKKKRHKPTQRRFRNRKHPAASTNRHNLPNFAPGNVSSNEAMYRVIPNGKRRNVRKSSHQTTTARLGSQGAALNVVAKAQVCLSSFALAHSVNSGFGVFVVLQWV